MLTPKIAFSKEVEVLRRWDKLREYIDMYTLAYVKQTASGKHLYRTVSSAQRSSMTKRSGIGVGGGREAEMGGIRVYL